MTRRVALLCGGISGERQVSLSSAAAVEEALQKRYEVVRIDTGAAGWANTLLDATVDGAFICLHGGTGENGSIQGFCESVDIPYTGPGVLSSAAAMDKFVTKLLVRSFCIPTPGYIRVLRGEDYDCGDIRARLGDKLVVKPSTEGSALGVSIVDSSNGLVSAIDAALELAPAVLIEQFIAGRELTVAVLGGAKPRALPPIEIVPANEFYDYEAKYEPNKAQHICPANLTAEELKQCEEMALGAHAALGCYGVSRTDCILDEYDHLWYLETNTIPGMTGTSLLPDAAKAVGIDFDELCWRIMEDAWGRC